MFIMTGVLISQYFKRYRYATYVGGLGNGKLETYASNHQFIYDINTLIYGISFVEVPRPVDVFQMCAALITFLSIGRLIGK